MYFRRNESPISVQIALYNGDTSIISLEYTTNWFNESSYLVMDLMGDFCEDFHTYEQAARAYNGLVPESEAIPLF